MKRQVQLAEEARRPFSHFGPEANHFDKLEELFRVHGETGGGQRRHYLHNEEEAEPWGQEPGTQHHHLGILGLDRKYNVKHDLFKDYNAVIARGGFPFIPHPTGWFPTRRYTREQIDALELLGDNFTMELINGANNIFDCYDTTDDGAIALWDQHLSRGKIVRGKNGKATGMLAGRA